MSKKQVEKVNRIMQTISVCDECGCETPIGGTYNRYECYICGQDVCKSCASSIAMSQSINWSALICPRCIDKIKEDVEKIKYHETKLKEAYAYLQNKTEQLREER